MRPGEVESKSEIGAIAMSDNPCAIGRSMELVPHFSYQSRREFVEELALQALDQEGTATRLA